MSNAVLYRGESVQPVTVLQVDSNLIYALMELNQRLRDVQNTRFLSENHAMMIEQLKAKVAGIFDKAHANVRNSYLQKIILQTKVFLLANLDVVKDQVAYLFDAGKFDEGIDFIVKYSKGNVKLPIPFWLRLFAPSSDKLLEQLGEWMKLNKELFKEKIGSELPPLGN